MKIYSEKSLKELDFFQYKNVFFSGGKTSSFVLKKMSKQRALAVCPLT
tara:strand:+ start:578 stop:721 length:144 start_codon:yes stop_codon:yes gene_type:complete